MNKKFFKGGLIEKPTTPNEQVLVLLHPGVSYVPKAAAENYDLEFFRKLSGVEKVILIEDKKNP